MDLTLLETLRLKIATGTNFMEVFEYFFDHFGEDPAFLGAGELVEPKETNLLTQLLAHIGSAIFKTDKIVMKDTRLIRVPEYQFIHGGFIMNGCMANVIYCEDLQKGILVVHRPKINPPTHFARFSAEMLPSNLTKEAAKFNQ